MKRIKREDSTDVEESVENEEQIHVINPLLMDAIAAQILDWLDVDGLKVARRVCTLWDREGKKAILKKCYLQTPAILLPQQQRRGNLEEDPKILKKLEKKQAELKRAFTQFLIPHESLKGLSVKVRKDKIPGQYDDDTQLFKQFPILYEKCTDLSYDKTDTSELLDMLENVSNLKFLTTSALDLQKQEPSENVLKKLQSLQELRLETSLTPPLLSTYLSFQASEQNNDNKKTAALTQPGKSWPMKKLKIVGIGDNMTKIFKIFNSSNILQTWNINSIELTVDTSSPIGAYHNFFSMISPSNLKIIVTGPYDSAKSSTTWREWHLPSPSSCPSLDKNLTSLDIDIEGKPDATRLWRPFAVSLQFSHLKRLTIKSLSSGYKFDKLVTSWNSDGNTQDRILESRSLEEVDLRTCFNFNLKSLRAEFWPNLRSIKLQLQQSQFLEPYGLSDIFKQLRQLRLDYLTLLLLPTDDVHRKTKYWDALLSGRLEDTRKDASENTKSSHSTIMHLKYLKSFVLESRCELSEDVGDHFIHNALIHLKTLQSLVIRGHKFTKPAIVVLKKALGPNTCVKLSKE